MKKSLITFLLTFLIIAGCAHKKNLPEEPVIKEKIRTVQVPQWFIDLPSGDYAIGISKLSIRNLEMKTAAFQNAVVQFCRNQSSFIVNKKALRETELSLSGNADFQVVVNSNPQLLRTISEELVLIDEFWFYDNYIGLFGLQETEIDKSLIELSYSDDPNKDIPGWYHYELQKESGIINATVRADSYSLESAWQKALDNARLKLAAFLETDVSSSVYHINEKMDKLITLETTRKMENIQVKRCFVKRYLGSGGPGYAVYIETGMKI